MPEEPSAQLLEGLKNLGSLEGFEATGEIEWRWKERVWVFPCQLTIPPPGRGNVPLQSCWWVRVDPSYPAGAIELLPAKDGGLATTFPHQSHNAPGPENVPWRNGTLCLHVGIDALRRGGFALEPRTAAERLRWHVQRALVWLAAADEGGLVAKGEPFELPDFRFGGGGRLACAEDRESLATWRSLGLRAGYVETKRLGKVLVAERFLADELRTVVHAPRWGEVLTEAKEGPVGLWVRVDEVPVVPPWQAPTSWSELVERCEALGLDLERAVLDLAERLLDSKGPRRERDVHPLLIGFPIPERFGGEAVRMHWIGFPLPPLKERTDSIDGFRNTKPRRVEHNRRELRNSGGLPWFTSESWSDRDLTGRGRLPEAVTDRHVLLLGAGTLGSVVAEMLVRGGVRRLTVLDPDAVEAGNLVRHTLDYRDVGKNKAKALADRLARVAPAVDAVGLSSALENVPARFSDRVRSADLVLDVTASDGVLAQLEELEWPGERIFLSLSMGLGCRRLYLFAVHGSSFPRATFAEAVAPWEADDWKGVDETTLPRAGAGCWQPLMPGSFYEVAMLAGAAVEVVSEMLSEGGPGPEPRQVVLEQHREGGRFGGIRRLSSGARPGFAV